MKKNGMYYVTEEYKKLINLLGGEWNDKKKRPIVCLVPSSENKKLYWAIPVGKVNHRDDKALERIKFYMDKDKRDIRSCFYHIGRTTNKSIFFITDAIPITEKYILEEHVGADLQHFILKNPNLITTLNYKLKRFLKFETERPNYFRQHITDIKNYLLKELKEEEPSVDENSESEQ